MSIYSMLETVWGVGAAATIVSQIPLGISPEYSKAYSIMLIVVTGLGILLARSVDALLKYKRGISTTDSGKLSACLEEKALMRAHYEEIITMKANLNSHLLLTISQLKGGLATEDLKNEQQTHN